jgi:porphobilinogen synthase
MVRETSLSVRDFIYPLFVKHGRDIRAPISSMPGQYQFSVDTLVEEAAGSLGPWSSCRDSFRASGP